MKYLICLFLAARSLSLPVITSTVDKEDDNYETSIENYKKSQLWGNWAMPIGKASASSTRATDGNSYTVKKIMDYNLNTAWVAGNENNGIGECIEFTFNFPKQSSYAGPYQFQGICDLFNGYCKSLDTWKDNSRVKKFKVYYNDIPLCYISVLDTWHFQAFDISRFFINKRYGKNLNAKYRIKSGDNLKFEIIDVYKGSKYNDLAISEFLCTGAGN